MIKKYQSDTNQVIVNLLTMCDKMQIFLQYNELPNIR